MQKFTCHATVFEHGYHWVDTRQESTRRNFPTDLIAIDREPRLRRRLALGRSSAARVRNLVEGDFRSYDIFKDEPGLFLTVSKTELTEEAILELVNRYGPFYYWCHPRKRIPPPSLFDLQWLIAHLRATVELWEAVKTRRQSDLERAVGQISYDIVDRFLPANPPLKPPMPDAGRRKEARASTSTLLSEAVKYLTHEITGAARGIHLKAVPVPDGRIELEFLAVNPADALYVQLGLAVAEAKEFRRCQECGCAFDASYGASRSDREFCRDSCRAKAYRRRRAQALSMFESGKSLQEIARSTGSDQKTVKGWLGLKGGKNDTQTTRPR